MMTKKVWIVFGMAMIAALSDAPVAAVEVFQWTDEDGVVHFSQWAPGDHVGDVETVSVDGDGGDNGLGISEEDDPEGYQAHREEMDALWSAIEDRREAARARSDSGPGTEIIYLGSRPDYVVPYGPPRLRPFPRPHPRFGQKPRRGPGEREEAGPPASVPFKRP